MRGLIIKDFLFLKNNWKTLIVFFIGSLLISVALGNYLLAVCAVPIVLLTSSINTFQTDEFFNTEAFTLTIPLSRRKIVTARYLFTIILGFVAFFVGLVIFYLIHFTINPGINGLNNEMIKYLLMLELSSLLVNAFFYPVIYKFGCEKSKFVMLSIVMVFLGIASIVSVYFNVIEKTGIDFTKVLTFVENNGLVTLTSSVFVLSIISYLLSIKFYKHRDF